MKEKIKQTASNYYKEKKYIPLVLFGVYLFLMLKYLNGAYFDTDELDVVSGGAAIANGSVLYKDYISQHMPISYFISALFWILGAQTAKLQRLFFYTFFSVVWAFCYQRYGKYFGKKILATFPVLFIISIGFFEHGYCILSEHLVGLGYIILLLEFALYLKTETLDWMNCIFISLSVLFSFGTSFVAIFAIATIVVGVIVKEVLIYRREKKYNTNVFLYFIKKYYKLIICCVIPWFILLLYFLFTGSLENFIYGAYTMNRTIYPKYYSYGDTIVKSLFVGIDYYYTFIRSSIELLCNGGINVAIISELIITVMAVIYIIYLLYKKKYLFGIVLIAFSITAASRGAWFFHGIQWVEVQTLFATCTVYEVILSNKNMIQLTKFKRIIVVSIMMIVVSANYFADFTSIFSASLHEDKINEASIIEKITYDDDVIWNNVLGTNNVCIQAKRVVNQQAAMVPWCWEAYSSDILSGWNGKPPKVTLLNTEQNVWGYDIKTYAPDLIEYVNQNYTHYSGYIYIRNDYYDIAMKLLNAQ